MITNCYTNVYAVGGGGGGAVTLQFRLETLAPAGHLQDHPAIKNNHVRFCRKTQ